jgi:hypothetical protein
MSTSFSFMPRTRTAQQRRLRGPRLTLAPLLCVLLVLLATSLGCGNTDFDPQSKVQTVRVLSTRADKPYAKPGEQINLEVLVADGRANKARPVITAWIPFPCLNPRDDLYYLCFAGAPNTTAGAGGGNNNNPLGQLRPGQDVTRFLPQGASYSFTMPEAAIIPRRSGDPYGLVVIFYIACAGRILIDELDPSKGVQQIPLACVDEFGARLPPSEYVIGLTRVYAYQNRRNENPVLQGVTFQGQPIDPKVGVTVDRCTETEMNKDKCPELNFDINVPESSQELNEGERDADGNVLREQLWATFYSTFGSFDGDARLLYDTRTGRNSDSKIRFYPIAPAQTGTMWVVVKDNRGGTNWLDFPLTVR